MGGIVDGLDGGVQKRRTGVLDCPLDFYLAVRILMVLTEKRKCR